MTPHFTLEELTFSNTAIRLGIDNTASEEIKDNLEILAEGLEQIRTKLDSRPLIISSGYRSLPLNRVIGSKDSSYHCKGLAADFKTKYCSIKEAMDILSESGIEFDKLILEFNSWIHVQFPEKGKKARRQVLEIDNQGVRFYS